MRILVFDNYDSFTYNLVHLVEKLTDADVDVFRNDQLTLEDIAEYDRIILSPGPGLPKDAGIMPQLIKEYASKKPILGVCLGHQAIGEAFGGKLVNLLQVYHGVATPVVVNGEWSVVNGQRSIMNNELSAGSNQIIPAAGSSSKPSPFTIHHSPLFDGLPSQIEVGRYHSWVVSEEDLPSELEITARDASGYIMALQHKIFNVQGVQFHPESVLTPCGETIIANWLKM